MKLGGWPSRKLRLRSGRWVSVSSLILSPLFFSLAESIKSCSLPEDTPGVPADEQILGQHQLALEGMTQMLNKMEFDEGVIAKGLTELGEARH